MAEMNSKWRVVCFLFPKEITIIVVIAAFVINPNNRFDGVAATPNSEFGNNKNAYLESNLNRRYDYRSEADEFYSPDNPLWREEQIYTGERQGTDPYTSSLRRPRRADGTNSSPLSPLAPRIKDIDDVASASYHSEFPLQSADIGRTGSGSNGIRSDYSEKPRGRRKWSFPIEFRRQKGRLSIGHSADNDPKNQRQNHRLLAADAVTSRSESRTVKGRNSFFSSSNKEDTESTIEKLSNCTTVSASTRNNDKTRDGQVSVSLDPFSLATLLQNGVTGLVGITSVYVGTLKLLGPMILAKHCLTTVGHIVNERSNGRLARKASTERLCYSEQNSLVDEQVDNGAARAITRTLFQILCMSCAGRFVGFVLDQTSCLLRPVWICQWWYGVVWLASVYTVGHLCQEGVFDYHTQSGNSSLSWLSIKSASAPMTFDSRNISINHRHRQRSVTRPLFQFFQKMSQNPEEWVSSLFSSVPRWKNRKNSHQGREMMAEGEGVNDTELDALLFPSTWKPLSVVTFLALSRAIFRSFCLKVSPSGVVGTLGDTACRGKNQYLIMRSFIIQKTLYSEWERVFVQERRVALGAGVSVIGLLALVWSIYSVSTVDPVAAMAMVPILMARLVSTWINILLSYNQIDVSSESFTWRDLVSHLNIAHD